MALAAYASHAALGPDQARLQLAAALAFGHGVARATLAPAGGLAMIAGWLLFAFDRVRG